MIFSVGVEYSAEDEAIGFVVPALCNKKYGCHGAADTESDLLPAIKEAVNLILLDMSEENKMMLETLQDEGTRHYKQLEEYVDYKEWMLVEIDTAPFSGETKRINIVLPLGLITAIDDEVLRRGDVSDRSHFIAKASRQAMR